jgi:lipopolysaccharide transport system ATP-binding protein
MSSTVISVENISKLYRLGEIGTGTLSHDLNRWWAKMRGKEDPFSVLGEVNDRSNKTESNYAWALKDVSFSLEEGEVLGVIGSNGAGKSTLLKIISEITTPTVGKIKIKGKIASLLEVGTGFHPELTGRENVFLNGAILGMRRSEIQSKFDEIVGFAGVERYIDTPVKRYSSGMYVRLAFAVAAHLEPEILIVDEVLAVGDSEFQKKCLGKMQDVSKNDGRTILFVSHNMQAVKSLCTQALWLHQGQLKTKGKVSTVVNEYLSGAQNTNFKQVWNKKEDAPGNHLIRFKKVELIPQRQNENDPLDIRTSLKVNFEFWNFDADINISVNVVLFSYSGECIFDVPSPEVKCNAGVVEGECIIPGNLLNDGSYYISLYVVKDTSIPLFDLQECLAFELEDYRGNIKWFDKWWGAVRPKLPFTLAQKDETLNS